MLRRYWFLFYLSVFVLTASAIAKNLYYLQGEPSGSPLWPVEKSRSLSALFADHRSFHFHSGIDIRTGGTTGYKVFACENGYVYRLFTSYWGYGKAVYLKLDDGRYAVYGHLSNFAKKLSEMVEKEQLAKKRYSVDFFPKKEELRVQKGELIGYSGQTGAGGPHLHFEIRDENEHPLNPLTSGFSIQDNLSPVMKYLVIKPQEIGSRVNGSDDPLIFPCRYDSRRKSYTLDKTPIIEGKAGLELSVYDRMEESGFKFGVWKIKLFLDGNLIFASHYDTISFNNTQKIELDRDFELGRKKGKEFYKLYVDEGNDLPLYNPSRGIINTQSSKPDSHQAKIIAYDANGNSSTLIFSLLFDRCPLISSCRIEEGGNNFKIKTEFDDPDDTVKKIVFEKSSLEKIFWQKFSQAEFDKPQSEYTLSQANNLDQPSLVRVKVQDGFGSSSDYKYILLNAKKTKAPAGSGAKVETKLNFDYSYQDNFFVFTLNFSQILKKEPQITLRADDSNSAPSLFEQTNEKSYRAAFHLKKPKQITLLVNGQDIYDELVRFEYAIPISIVTKSHGGEAKSEDGTAQAKVDAEIVYKDINLSVKKKETTKSSNYERASAVYSFEPSTVPLNGLAKICLKYSGKERDPQKLGLYELTEEGWWKLIGKDLDTTSKSVSGKVRYFSNYALLKDTKPPLIKKVDPYPGKKTRQRKPKIEAVVRDDLSGIGSDQDVLVTIDGEWMIPEYDPETNVLFTRPTFPLSYGKHELLISVKDRCGNKREVRRNFFVVR
jgi:hypothetical protein